MKLSILNLQLIVAIFAVGFAVSFILTPLSIVLAKKFQIIDKPCDRRRMHHKAIPRFGGIAICAGTMASMAIFDGENENIRIAMLGGAMMYIVGAADDIKNLSPWIKLICQTIVAMIMYGMGIRITLIENYFGTGLVTFGKALCFIVTILWIVGITNTINLIDGLDGLAAGTTAIASLCIAYIAYIHGTTYGMVSVCIALMAIAGACTGFLPFNFSPAKTFMGDGGSLFLGFMLAALSIISPLKRSTLIAVIVPVVTLAIPIFDTFYAIIRRTLRGEPIMKADKRHLHHMLVASGHGQARSVIMLYGITAIMGMSAVLISRELYKDAVVLMIIVVSYLYVFITDPAHILMQRKREARESRRARREAEQDAENDERAEIEDHV